MSVPPFRSPVTEPLHAASWVRPSGNTDYRVTQTFAHVNEAIDPNHPHGAIDIGNFRLGGPIYAAGAGKVIAVGNLTVAPFGAPSSRWASGNYGGLTTVIDHGDGWYSLYCHQATSLVKAGASVIAGQKIGTIGESGSAAGSGHLHFEVQHPKGVKVDPWPLLAQNYVVPDTGISQPKESDVRISGSFIDHVINQRTTFRVESNFRDGSSLAAAVLQIIPVDVVFLPTLAVAGEKVGGEPDARTWYGGWLYLNPGGWSFGYAHSSILQRAPDGHAVAFDAVQTSGGVTPEQLTAAVAAATDPLTRRIAAIKQKVAANAADIAND